MKSNTEEMNIFTHTTSKTGFEINMNIAHISLFSIENEKRAT